MLKSLAIAALLSVLALASANACALHLRLADPTTLTWDRIDGIDYYEVQESFDDFATSRNWFVRTPPFNITHRVSGNVTAKYIVTAVLSTSILSAAETCTEKLSVTLQTDPQFRTLTGKAVVPIVGSLAGAFGSRFKTSLKLTASTSEERGKIIFHPAGAVAGPSDPSTSYVFQGGVGDTIVFDDIVAQLGANGVGSLDIVPETGFAQAVPFVEARLYNDTPGGTFGTTAQAAYPFDYLQAPTLTLIVPSDPFRMNLGLRTLTATTAKALIYNTDGRLRTFVDLSWPADFTTFGTVGQILTRSVVPGEKVILYFNGAAIPFYTVTENRTNDPELFVARPEHSTALGFYVE